MDINNPTSWDLELMAMEEHLLHSQVPFNHSLLPYSYIPVDQIPSNNPSTSAHFNCQVANCVEGDEQESDQDLGGMKEMMYRIASMQPVDIDPATIRKPRRKNVRISDDPQSVAARLRREKISEKMRILQRLVPGGTRLDTASMLDEAIRYIKFLKRQIRLLQSNHQPQSNNFSLGSSSSTPIDWSLRANGGSASTEPGFGSSTVGRKMGYLKHEDHDPILPGLWCPTCRRSSVCPCKRCDMDYSISRCNIWSNSAPSRNLSSIVAHCTQPCRTEKERQGIHSEIGYNNKIY